MPKLQPTASAHILKRRDYDGVHFLKNGFRPFFLGAGLWSAIAMAVWLSFLFSGDELSLLGYFSAQDWHIHEMLYGYLPAAIAGFLLTAIPNWTGRLPVRGIPLALLAALWLIGRIAILVSGRVPESYTILIAGLDSLFLVSLTALLAREIFSSNNRKNAPVVAIIAALAASNILFHMATLELISFASSQQIALAGILLSVLLVTLIGGRVVPSFTRNWMVRNKIEPLPAPRDHIDTAGSALIPLSSLSLLIAPQSLLCAILCIFTALIHFFRLARWHGMATMGEPLVFILHVGYGWIGVGFFLAGLSALTEQVSYIAAVHAFSAGALGAMILAVMTRATRGHTGNALEADWGTTALYILVNLSALIRVASALWGFEEWGYLLSGISWVAAFSLFSFLYFPLFTKG